jgi:F0F1-type ATP synthase assembly protein I
MKNMSNRAYLITLALSIVLVVFCFLCADWHRGYDGLGGEVFMIALPFVLIRLRRHAIEDARAERARKMNIKNY